MFRFDNQRVLIVGGSSGIGFAAAAGFAEAGASVTIAARNLERLKQAAAKLGRGVQAAQLDVTDDKAVEQFFEREAPWRHVVVSGSSVRFGPARKLPLFDAYAAMNSKFWGAYRVARVARIESEGSLTLVSGVLSRRPSPDFPEKLINTSVGRDSDGKRAGEPPGQDEPRPRQGEPRPGRGEPRPGERDRQHTQQ